MNIVATLFKIFFAGTMSVYPNVGMYGSGIIQSVQAGYRLGSHFGLFKSGSKAVSQGPVGEQGTYAWWQDANLIFKNVAPVAQRLLQGSR